MVHNARCAFAHTDVKFCRCSCKGLLHNKNVRGGNMSNDKVMSIAMGGDVAEFIEQWRGALIKCFGVCHSNQVMDSFFGYPHDGGLADANGEKWWVYFECPKCRYGHSFAKMDFFKKHTEIEIRAEGVSS